VEADICCRPLDTNIGANVTQLKQNAGVLFMRTMGKVNCQCARYLYQLGPLTLVRMGRVRLFQTPTSIMKYEAVRVMLDHHHHHQRLYSHSGPWPPIIRFLKQFLRHMVRLPGRVISPSQFLYLHMTTQHRKTKDKQPCPKRDSNSRSSYERSMPTYRTTVSGNYKKL
jgi:hypothetical protein